MVIVKREDTTFVVLRAYSTWEFSDTAAVLVVSVTPAQVQEWRDRLAFVATLRTEHEQDRIAHVAYWDHTGSEWRKADPEAEEMLDPDNDVPFPDWSDEEDVVARTEVDVIEVSDADLTFSCIGKYTDEHMTAVLYANELDAIDAALLAAEEK
jgi:hypothetical protein